MKHQHGARFVALLSLVLSLAMAVVAAPPVYYRTETVDGLRIFYRESGDPKKPTLLLLHGFPTSSHMFRDLIPLLADKYHVVAPDYPGFGNSAMPTVGEFRYTFDNLADIIEKFVRAKSLAKFSIYVQDYGAPVGFRLAVRHPEWIQAIISQNGNAYDEGLTAFWKPLQEGYWKNPNAETEKPLLGLLTLEGTKFQYVSGAKNPESISPDAWNLPAGELARPGNREIQLALFYDYRTNPPMYGAWHTYFRASQVPILAVWGKNDPIFGAEGAKAFSRDSKNAEVHLLDTGHFALEEESGTIAAYMLDFLRRHVASGTKEATLEQNVRAFYANLGRGDLPAALSLLSPDIDWTTSAGFPVIGGVYKGTAAVREKVFGRLATDWNTFGVVPDKFLPSGANTVIVTGHYAGKFRPGSPALNAAFVHIWESANGKIVRFTHTSDTATVRDARH